MPSAGNVFNLSVYRVASIGLTTLGNTHVASLGPTDGFSGFFPFRVMASIASGEFAGTAIVNSAAQFTVYINSAALFATPQLLPRNMNAIGKMRVYDTDASSLEAATGAEAIYVRVTSAASVNSGTLQMKVWVVGVSDVVVA